MHFLLLIWTWGLQQVVANNKTQPATWHNLCPTPFAYPRVQQPSMGTNDSLPLHLPQLWDLSYTTLIFFFVQYPGITSLDWYPRGGHDPSALQTMHTPPLTPYFSLPIDKQKSTTTILSILTTFPVYHQYQPSRSAFVAVCVFTFLTNGMLRIFYLVLLLHTNNGNNQHPHTSSPFPTSLLHMYTYGHTYIHIQHTIYTTHTQTNTAITQLIEQQIKTKQKKIVCGIYNLLLPPRVCLWFAQCAK